MKRFSPILVGTLNRYEHFKRCIESLKKCQLANESQLFIALYYPKESIHEEGYLKIKKYLSSITGFKSLEIIKRKENFGATKNFNTARDEIFSFSDKLILSEDDNTFSTKFLAYMNNGLNLYENRKDIFAICGYMYPHKIGVKDEIFLYRGHSAWGWGCWKDKFKEVSFNISEANKLIQDQNFCRKITAKHVLKHLRNSIKTNKITNDTYICLHLYKHNMVSVFPKETLVKIMVMMDLV